MTSEIEQLREFAQRYTEAWCSHDRANVAAFYSSIGALSINSGAPAVGRTAIKLVALEFMTAFPDLRVFTDAKNGNSALTDSQSHGRFDSADYQRQLEHGFQG